MHKIVFFPENFFFIKKTCVPTLPKVFRPATRNTLFFILPYQFLAVKIVYSKRTTFENCNRHLHADVTDVMGSSRGGGDP